MFNKEIKLSYEKCGIPQNAKRMSKTILKNNSKAKNEVIKKYKRSHAESGRLEGGYEVLHAVRTSPQLRVASVGWSLQVANIANSNGLVLAGC